MSHVEASKKKHPISETRNTKCFYRNFSSFCHKFLHHIIQVKSIQSTSEAILECNHFCVNLFLLLLNFILKMNAIVFHFDYLLKRKSIFQQPTCLSKLSKINGTKGILKILNVTNAIKL